MSFILKETFMFVHTIPYISLIDLILQDLNQNKKYILFLYSMTYRYGGL